MSNYIFHGEIKSKSGKKIEVSSNYGNALVTVTHEFGKLCLTIGLDKEQVSELIDTLIDAKNNVFGGSNGNN